MVSGGKEEKMEKLGLRFYSKSCPYYAPDVIGFTDAVWAKNHPEEAKQQLEAKKQRLEETSMAPPET